MRLARMLVPAALTVLGAAALWFGTDGLRAYTTEAARRIDLVEQRRALPDARLLAHDGTGLDLASLRGRLLVVDFIYTRCPTMCREIGSKFAGLQRTFSNAVENGRLVLLSISIDPEHDGPDELRDYRLRHGASERGWLAVAPATRSALDELLDELSIKVIPDGYGGWVHSGALHLIDRSGIVAGVFDADDGAALRGAIEARL